MQALALIPGTATLRIVERPEPQISAPDDVKVRVLQVGICGTDREQAHGGRALPPEGQDDLVIGHEMLGQVIEVGSAVISVRPGDYAVFTVRRGCGTCEPCVMNRSDMCLTGNYRERGIWGLDGYQAEYVVDKEQYIVAVPRELAPVGVLAEPLSVVEKAIDEAVRVQRARVPTVQSDTAWLAEKRCLVAGLGPVGLLAAMVLRLRGAWVYGLDIVDSDTARPQWLAVIGGQYIDGRRVPASQVDDIIGPMDLIVEATGVAELEFNLLDALAVNGIYVLTGIPGGDHGFRIDGADLIRQLVLGNQSMLGSVNAAREHFLLAVQDLGHACRRWGQHVQQLITSRQPVADFKAVLSHHAADEIKAVLEW